MNKFRRGDQVIVISGSGRGKVGKVLSVSGNRVSVEGVAIATVHKKPTQSAPGQIIKAEKFIHISNISHIENGKPVKVKFQLSSGSGDGKTFKRKDRVSKRSNKKIG